MRHSQVTETLFNQAINETPQEIKQEVEWSYEIADKIYETLHRKGMSQKEFAHLAGTSEAAVSKWIGGGHNFTLATLAKISSVLGESMIQVTVKA